MAVQETSAILLDFFNYLFSKDEGYVCIATTRPPARRDTFSEQWFEWPSQKHELIDYVEKVTPTHNVYFGVNLFSVPRRKKENTIPQNLVWADLDTCRPDKVHLPPQCVIESSPGRYQTIWRMDRKVDPFVAENYGRRIAYQYADQGADKSGFDLTQLLRVPGTNNFKYELNDVPQVRLISLIEDLLPVEVFDALPEPDSLDLPLPDIDLPDPETLPSVETIIERYEQEIRPTAFGRYYAQEPLHDWSKSLWRLINLCFDAGMEAREVFVVAKNSKCNKYERDGRPDSHLWREVLKAEIEHKSIEVLLNDHRSLVMPVLLTANEEKHLGGTILDDYMGWATEVTDAVPIFHEITCALVMSMLMSTTLRLETSNAKVYPNLWALVLGDSTLTRKTTAMDMGMGFIHDIDRDLIVASEASPEGLMTSLSLRPKMVSVFYRDEVTGFFGAINSKQYLADLPELMTKMYDVPKYLPKTLRASTYVVSEPIFIFFGGGIPDRLYQQIEESYFTSGFVSRFLVVKGEADISTRRPIGPPKEVGVDRRNELLDTFRAFHSMYTDQHTVITLGDGQQMQTTPEIQVLFPDSIWKRAGEMELALLKAANDSSDANKARPAFSRMFFSILKLTMLFAAARQEPVNYTVFAEDRDLYNAAYYIQRWGVYMVDLIMNSGASKDETLIMSAYRTIERRPGIHRGQLMQYHRLNAKNMTLIEETLVQRMMIQVATKGRGRQYWPIGR